MNKFVLYLIVVGLLSVSELSASFVSEESKENFLSSLQRSLRYDTNVFQLENTNYNVVSQSFKSIRNENVSYLDEFEAIPWISDNKDLDINIYPTKNKRGTYYVRILGYQKEFELILK